MSYTIYASDWGDVSPHWDPSPARLGSEVIVSREGKDYTLRYHWHLNESFTDWLLSSDPIAKSFLALSTRDIRAITDSPPRPQRSVPLRSLRHAQHYLGGIIWHSAGGLAPLVRRTKQLLWPDSTGSTSTLIGDVRTVSLAQDTSSADERNWSCWLPTEGSSAMSLPGTYTRVKHVCLRGYSRGQAPIEIDDWHIIADSRMLSPARYMLYTARARQWMSEVTTLGPTGRYMGAAPVAGTPSLYDPVVAAPDLAVQGRHVDLLAILDTALASICLLRQIEVEVITTPTSAVGRPVRNFYEAPGTRVYVGRCRYPRRTALLSPHRDVWVKRVTATTKPKLESYREQPVTMSRAGPLGLLTIVTGCRFVSSGGHTYVQVIRPGGWATVYGLGGSWVYADSEQVAYEVYAGWAPADLTSAIYAEIDAVVTRDVEDGGLSFELLDGDIDYSHLADAPISPVDAGARVLRDKISSAGTYTWGDFDTVPTQWDDMPIGTHDLARAEVLHSGGYGTAYTNGAGFTGAHVVAEPYANGEPRRARVIIDRDPEYDQTVSFTAYDLQADAYDAFDAALASVVWPGLTWGWLGSPSYIASVQPIPRTLSPRSFSYLLPRYVLPY